MAKNKKKLAWPSMQNVADPVNVNEGTLSVVLFDFNTGEMKAFVNVTDSNTGEAKGQKTITIPLDSIAQGDLNVDKLESDVLGLAKDTADLPAGASVEDV